MADDKAKKTKIDLKARLGRTTQMGIAPPGGLAPLPAPPGSMPGAPDSNPGPGSVPAPPASRPSSMPASAPRPTGIPMGIAPPASLGVGINLPQFAPQQRQAPRAEPKPSAAQQTIKVELGEEIHEERKKARNRAMAAAFGGAIVGIVIGLVAGDSRATGERSKTTARNAGVVEKEVKSAFDKLKDLDQKITDASDKLGKKEFPNELSGALAGLVIPFEVTNLDKPVPQRLTRPVATFYAQVENINRERESLKKLADFAKDPVTKAYKEEAAPMANFSVIFRQDGKNVVADLVPNPTPFAWKGDQPGSYKVSKPEGARAADKDAKHYVKGDLPGNDLTAIPVDPKSMTNLAPELALLGRLQKAVYDMHADLQGKGDDPNAPPGLLKAAEDLDNELRKAALNQ
jgi:hypothetical protein